jgi:hypothetical protein
VFLSFLEGERDRDFVNVSDRDLVQYDRFRPFTLPDRSPFMTVPERFRSFYERFRLFVTYLRRSTGIRIININGKKIHKRTRMS